MTLAKSGSTQALALRRQLASYPRARVRAMYSAANDLLTTMHSLAARGRSVLTETLAPGKGIEAAVCTEWAHYPANDIFAPHRGGLAYYHAHPAKERAAGEHGHFHLFASPHRPPVSERRSFVHLFGISLNNTGQPIRLFTTNRWVTDESWRDAPAVLRLASGFELPHTRPSRALNRWLSALPILFRPQLETLLAERDARIARRVQKRLQRVQTESPSQARYRILEDRKLHVISQCGIDLPGQIAAIEDRLN